MPKRFIQIVLPLVLISTLAACGGGGGGSDAPAPPPVVPPEDLPQPGEPLLDTAFGNGGVVVDEVDYATGSAVITDAMNRVVVVGSSTSFGNSNLAVWRFLTDGTPDPGFGTNGVFIHDASGGGADGGLGVTIDSSNRILVAGFTVGPNGTLDMALWRIADNGVLDGLVTVDNTISGGNQNDQGLSVAIDSLERIVVTGRSQGAIPSELAVWRFESDGSPDLTFAFSGQYYSNNPGSEEQGNAIVVDGMDRVIVTGFKNLSLATWRLTEMGAPDITFGVNGIQAITFNGASLSGTGIVRDSQGRLLLSGIRDFSTGTSDLLSFRLFESGGVDLDYGGAGFTEYANPLGSALATGIALDLASRIILVGTVVDQSGTESVFDAAAWRLDPDGNLDPTFGGNGAIFFDTFPNPVNTEGRAVTVDGAGRIILAGANSDEPNLDQDTVVWRLDP